MKISTRILATLGVVAVLPAIGLVYIAHRETCREIGAGLDRNLRASAERTAAQVDGFVLARLEEVRSLATLPGMQSALDERTRSVEALEQAQQVLSILEARDPVNSIAFGLVDASGTVLVDAEPSCVGMVEATQAYFRETLTSGLPWANHQAWGADDAHTLVVASPVRDARGRPVGVLRLVLENATLQQLLCTAAAAATDHDLVLFDEHGRLIADAMAPTRRHGSMRAPTDTAATNADGMSLVDWATPDGETAIPGRAAFTPLRHAAWQLMAWQTKAAYEATATGLGKQRLHVLGLLLLLLVAAAWLASRWIARPLQRLERAAMAIADGELEVTIPAGSGEIGTLGKTLQQMKDRLLATMGDLQRAADEARCASAAKSQFLANMSHELRTPLTAILGFAELLADEAAEGSEEPGHAATIHRNAEHLLGLVNEVLDLAKVESGTMETSLEDFSPIDLARSVVDLLHVTAREKGLGLRCKIGAVPPSLRSDPHRLKQILINLVGNAIKFTDSGAVEVSIGVAGQPSLLICEVTDTGPGIPAEKLDALFQPFSQVDATMTRRHGGTGLGLAISRQLARKLGGDLIAHSRLGEGSTFVLTVPADVRPQTSMPAPHVPTQDRLEGRILVVEDGADNRRLLQHLLDKAGAHVELAEDGMQGLCALSRNGDPAAGLADPLPFDLVLMDMQMPVLDGLSATRQLRTMGLHIPIIALTAHAMDEARDQCLQAGCDEWATKPIRRADLLAVCATWLARSRRATTAHAALANTRD